MLRILLILQSLFLCFSCGDFASKNQDSSYASANNDVDHYSSNETEYIKCLNPEQSTSECSIYFNFESENTITNVDLFDSQLDLDFSITNNTAIVLLSNFDYENIIHLHFDYCNNRFSDYMLYVVYNNGMLFSSDLSLDCAKRNAGIFLDYDYETMVDDDNDDDDETLPSRFGYASGRIYGTFMWLDGGSPELMHPLYNACIELSLTNSIWKKTTYTNSNGYFSISFKGIGHLFQSYTPILTVILKSPSVSACLPLNGLNGHDLIYAKSFYLNFENGSELEVFRTFFPNSDFGKAIQAFQAGIYYSEFAKNICNEGVIKHCKLIYPYRDKDDPGFYYSNNEIYIDVSDDIYDSESQAPLAYQTWDVIGHEYGHHVLHCNGINKSPGGGHDDGDLIDYLTSRPKNPLPLNKAKPAALYLAWAEGFATFWGVTVQKHFPAHIQNIRYVGDPECTSNDGKSVNLNTNHYNSYAGETCQDTISRLLYQISDDVLDSFDSICIPDTTLYPIIFSNKIDTLSSFIITLYQMGYDFVQLGYLLNDFHLTTPVINKTGGDYLDSPPTFSWWNDYGTSPLSYNDFDLLITDGNSLLFEKLNISTNSYTLSQAEWSYVCSQSSLSTYYVHIISKQTSYVFSGYYCSKPVPFSFPNDYVSKSLIKPIQWGFEPQYFFVDNKWKQTSNPITNKWLTITHDRLRCGYIENSYVVLSPKRKNAGMAYLTMNFNVPVHWYKLNISLWSNSEGLFPSNCTACIQEKNANGFWTTRFDLLNNYALSTNPEYMNTLEFNCPNDIYGLRIIVTSPATGDRNKGRICLGDMVFDAEPLHVLYK